MDIALQNARNEKQRIEAQMASLRDRLREVDSFIAMYQQFTAPQLPPLPLPMPPIVIRPAKKPSLPDAVAALIGDGPPLQTSTLLDSLLHHGYEIGGGERAKQLTNLSSTLSRDARFRNQRGIGWSLIAPQKVESPSPVSAGDGLDDL